MLQERIDEHEMKLSKGKDILRRREEETAQLKQSVDECNNNIAALTSQIEKLQEKNCKFD